MKDLHNYAYIDDAIMQPVNLNEMLENILFSFPPEKIRDIAIEKKYSELHAFICYPEQLKQVFTNILQHAVESIRTAGNVKIETYFSNGLHVRITDNGIGIPKVIQKKIFAPFFTTKEIGEGMGFGLSIAERIVKKHEGNIQIESEAGKGTSVTVSFPNETEKKRQTYNAGFENGETNYDSVKKVEECNDCAEKI